MECIINDFSSKKDIAILIPCLNEESTIADVVTGFKESFSDSNIYVYDNGSTDQTVDYASRAGAITKVENTPGKGCVVRRMFADIEAEIYVIVDGDGTYDPSDAPKLVKLLDDFELDMVVGSRKNSGEYYRTGHALGNKVFNKLYSWLFGEGFSDIFSGYRVFSRRFVKSFPAISSGFEIETEISVHASQLRLPVAESDIDYKDRPEGSKSKLRTFSDGWKILKTMVTLLKDNRPLAFFGTLSALSFVAAIVIGVPIVVDFSQTGLVEKLPSAILATGLVLVSLVALALGLILDSLTRGRIEIKRLSYLNSH